MVTRRDLLRYAGAAAASFVVRSSEAAGAPTVTMLYWNHFVPSFIPLLNRQVEQWARSRGVNARVDYISLPDMPARLAAEAQARTGHDIIQLSQWNA